MEDVSAPTWDEVRASVTRALAALPDRGFLVLGEPTPPPAPKARGVRGLLGGREPQASTRFAQVLRDGDQLGAECVGAQSFGGLHQINSSTDARLRDLGWLAPGDAEYEVMGGPAYRRWVPFAEVDEAAALLVDSLAVLGLSPTGPLELTVGS